MQELDDRPLLLIVDDEQDIVSMLSSYFELEGFRVVSAQDGVTAQKLASLAPDAILLDVNMPTMDGIETCRTMRKLVSCPIIFLTARVEDSDMLAGFAAGGDDYVTKPFSLAVLAARVKAQIARQERNLNRASVRYGDSLVVDLSKMEARVNGTPIPLARKDFDILALLARRPEQVFDRDMIYELVWKRPGDSAVVTEHVRRLRKALSEAGCDDDPIKTVWGVGYTWRN